MSDNYKKRKIVVSILILMGLIIIGFIVSILIKDKNDVVNEIDNKDDYEVENDESDNTDEDIDDVVEEDDIDIIDFSVLENVGFVGDEVEEKFEDILNNQLYILFNKKSVDEISNQEKLQIALEMYKNEASDYFAISGTSLENAYSNTVLRNMKFEHNNIIDYYRTRLFSEILYTYDRDNNSYTYNNIGHGAVAPYAIYTSVDYEEVDENKYEVSAQFVFTIAKGDGPTSLDLYYTYEDVVNQKPFIKGPAVENPSEYDDYKSNLAKYIINNYDLIQPNLKTYNYTFDKINDDFVLVDFSVE